MTMQDLQGSQRWMGDLALVTSYLSSRFARPPRPRSSNRQH